MEIKGENIVYTIEERIYIYQNNKIIIWGAGRYVYVPGVYDCNARLHGKRSEGIKALSSNELKEFAKNVSSV